MIDTQSAGSAAPTSCQPRSAQEWTRILLNYRTPSNGRSIFEIFVTFVPFAALWSLTWAAVHFGYWQLLAVLWLLAAGFLVRLFLIQHDCGHGSFFRHRATNDWIGRALGVLTLTPYDTWRHAHAIHHSTTGHLEQRGIGDIDTLTVSEYKALPWLGRLRYRAYRHPLTMFLVGPAYMFLVRHRLPAGMLKCHWTGWFSTMATNLAIAVVAVAFIWLVGVGPFLLVQLPITLLAASIGVWLFYVQHQFEQTVWEHSDDWSLQDAALHGSSHYDLPGPLRWLTANIGIHHVHHLCSRIPYYRLPKVLKDYPELQNVSRLTLLDSLACVRLTLWDKNRQKLVSFREAAA